MLTKTGYANGFTYDSLSRLTNYNGTAISYDYAGNPLNWVGVTDMVYSRRNLLASANANGTAVSYAYDGEGRRISKSIGGVTQTFYYEGDRLAAWKNGSDTYYFLYDNTGISGFYRNGLCYMFAKNMLGDVLALYLVSGTAATLVARYEYDAWGVCKVKNADGTLNASASFMGNINPFRYRGYFYDAELGLYWLQTRHYDPKIGRFLTKDSMEYYDHTAIDGLNLYAYCTNDPVNKYDPFGHFWDYVLDFTFIAIGAKDFADDPSWKKGLWLALDVTLAVIPFVPAIGGIRHVNKVDNFIDLTKTFGHIDNFADAGGVIRKPLHHFVVPLPYK